jgi:hypothetical protein
LVLSWNENLPVTEEGGVEFEPVRLRMKFRMKRQFQTNPERAAGENKTHGAFGNSLKSLLFGCRDITLACGIEPIFQVFAMPFEFPIGMHKAVTDKKERS